MEKGSFQNLKRKFSELKEEATRFQSEIYVEKQVNEDLNKQIKTLQNQVKLLESQKFYYVSEGGTCYHTKDCKNITRGFYGSFDKNSIPDKYINNPCWYCIR